MEAKKLSIIEAVCAVEMLRSLAFQREERWGQEAEKCVHAVNVPSVSFAAASKKLLSVTSRPGRQCRFCRFCSCPVFHWRFIYSSVRAN